MALSILLRTKFRMFAAHATVFIDGLFVVSGAVFCSGSESLARVSFSSFCHPKLSVCYIWRCESELEC